MRVFLAIDIPKDLRNKLAQLQAELKKKNGSVRWVRPKIFHLTVFFLGSLEEEEVGKVGEGLEAELSSFPSFYLSLGGLSLLPDPKRPRTIVLQVKGDLEVFSALRQKVEVAIKLALPNLDRKFLKEKEPHLTLGRIKNPSYVPPRGMVAIEEEFKVRSLVLMKSRLTSQGPIYTPLKKVRFS